MLVPAAAAMSAAADPMANARALQDMDISTPQKAGAEAGDGLLVDRSALLPAIPMLGYGRALLLTVERSCGILLWAIERSRRGDRQRRSPAGYARHAGAEGAAARADARMGHYRTHRTMVGEHPATWPGDALPCPLSSRTTGTRR